MTVVRGRADTWRDRLPRPMIVPRLRDLRQRPQPGQRLRALRMGDPWFAGIVVVWAFLIAGSVVAQQWQGLATLVWVPGFAMLFLQWPAIGTGLLFGIWVFAPFFRRLLDLVAPALGADILSLTPFMATLSLAYIAYRKYKPPPAINLAVGTVLLGFGVGSVTGLSSPLSLLFGLFAYCSAVFGVYIGYANGRERRFTMEQLLMPLVLISSVYGVYQGLVSQLPSWDQLWLVSHTFVSVGSKETGNFRVFSFLNSPYTYASLVAVYLAVLFVSRKVSLLRLATGLAALMGIFLTQSRGAWVSVVGGLVILTFFTGGKALPRLIGLALTLVGMYVALGSTPAGSAVVQRASSVANGSNDVSGKSRIGAITELGPPALAAPIGSGIGSVGAASVLNANPKASLVDNGYLIMLVQVGPIGFLLLGGGIAYMIFIVLRGSTVEDRRNLVPLLAPIGVYIPLSFFSETLYGIPGFILFYALGEALGRRHVEPEPVGEIIDIVPIDPLREPEPLAVRTARPALPPPLLKD
ncbi:MAG: hypothetical protein AAGC46_14705 [Solirubrobacteraceae bacterium]|nr:hypothetical protein [Patulibacter sp.]